MTLKKIVESIADEFIREKGEVSKQDIYDTLKQQGYGFDPIEKRAERADLAQINRVLSSIIVDGKRRYESVRRKDEEGKARFVRIPAPMLKVDAEAAKYAREQSAKRIAGEARKSPVTTELEGQTVLRLFREAN